MRDSKVRFSDRVEDYVKYRPSYPSAVVDYLKQHLDLGPSSTVADVGSGTGIFSKLLLATCRTVYGVEPNREMREAGTRHLTEYRNFISISGSSEATTLPDGCVDFVAAAQAFHWFEPGATKVEFQRILRPGGKVILVWNRRLFDTPFLRKYEEILAAHAPEYKLVNHTNITETEIALFLGSDFRKTEFPNFQELDWENLLGRMNSSSYVPEKGSAENRTMERSLREAYDSEAVRGKVEFRYTCQLFYGEIR